MHRTRCPFGLPWGHGAGSSAAYIGATTTPATGTALADLARQGSDAAGFAASGVHVNGYTATVTTALLEWLEQAIDHTT